jgi:hypothetical protein
MNCFNVEKQQKEFYLIYNHSAMNYFNLDLNEETKRILFDK